MRTEDRRLLRASLILVWLATAAISVWEVQGQSQDMLSAAGLTDPGLNRTLILGGAGLDALLGLLLWLRPGRRSYELALAGMLLMTLAATVLLPALWLNPLGPLLKNIPIAAVLWVLRREAAA